MERQPFQTRAYLLRGQTQREAVIALAQNLPLDEGKPLEVVFREQAKPRKPDQNAAYWAGPLRDIAEQAWHEGRQFSAEIWHELFKVMYLPEDDDPNLAELVMDGYRKWDYLPNGDRVCIGSTTKLKVKGMAQYTTQVYVFTGEQGKRDSIIVVAQLSPELTARLVDRWQELEKQRGLSLPDFTNPAAAARAWADEVEAKQAAVLQLEQARPAVRFVEKYVGSTGLKSFREVCKTLQANESRFREFLVDTKVVYRLNGAWVPYQNHIDAGRLMVKAGVSERNGHAFSDVRFTPKGVNWVAGEWGKYQLQREVA